MSAISPEHKKTLSVKLLEFRKKGLQQYGKYLDQQLKMPAGKKHHAAYRKYIEQQIILNDRNISRIDAKLK